MFTFLFTDIEGSTALLGRVGQGVYARVLADHHAIIRAGLACHGGREVDTQGDAFFAAFSSPAACVAAVLAMQRALQAHGWPGGERVRVRMGVHAGQASQTAAGLVGLDVHRAARIAAAGHGGQVLVSQAAAALVRSDLPPGAGLADLGVHRLKDLEGLVQIFQLRAGGLLADFPPLRTVPGGVAAATRTLPRDLVSFTGRQRELAELIDAAAGAAGGVVGIHAIGGMAGVGKTAFAARDLEEALGLYRDLGNRGGEVTALNEAGTLSRVRGDLRQAGSCHQQALDLARQIGSSWDEAHALAGLGRCALAASRTVEAEGMLRQAVAIFQRIGAAETADVSAELDALTAARPTSHES